MSGPPRWMRVAARAAWSAWGVPLGALVALGASVALGVPAPVTAQEEPADVEARLPPDRHFDSDGVRIRYVVQGEGPPVVLVHGFSVDLELNWVWNGLFPALARDFRVVAFDHRGHGKSEKPRARAAYGAEMVEDVVRLMDHLGIESAHVVGYSMGAAIGVKLLEMAPGRIRSLVLGGGGWAPLPVVRIGEGRRPLDEPPPPPLGRWPAALAEAPRADGSVTDALWLPGWPEPSPETRERLDANDPLALLAVLAGLPELAVGEVTIRASETPTLLIGGGEDRFFLPAVAAMRGVKPNLEVEILPGLDHVSAIMDPALSRGIREFLSREAGR